MATDTAPLAPEQAEDTDLSRAVNGYLARYKGLSRKHTRSDLRVFLTWCAGQELDPLTACRHQLELYVRWLQEVRRFKPPCCDCPCSALVRRPPSPRVLNRRCADRPLLR